MKPRALLVSLAALLLVAGTVPAYAAPPVPAAAATPVVSITLVLRPQAPGAPAQTYVAANVPVGPGPELRGACGLECVDYAHPTVDINLGSRTITVMVPGSEYQFTDAELTVTTDLIAGFRGLGPGRERGADSRQAEVTSDGARMTWTSYTGFAPATVVFEIDTTAPAGAERPTAPGAGQITVTPLPDTTAPAEATPTVGGGDGPGPVAPGTPPATTAAEAAAPVVSEPTFAG